MDMPAPRFPVWLPATSPGEAALSRARTLEKIEELADLVVGLGCVPHLEVSVQVVAIAPPDLLAFHVTGLDQIGDDPLRCPFCDPTICARSRNRTWGSRAIQSSTCVWFERNRQLWLLSLLDMKLLSCILCRVLVVASR
jgi:hypothetical protein